jgi:hypothetical protein
MHEFIVQEIRTELGRRRGLGALQAYVYGHMKNAQNMYTYNKHTRRDQRFQQSYISNNTRRYTHINAASIKSIEAFPTTRITEAHT